jgi:cytochrome c
MPGSPDQWDDACGKIVLQITNGSGAMTIGRFATLGASVAGIFLIAGIFWTSADHAKAASKIVLPTMNAQNGKMLFASKGCVICHQVNGIGGKDGGALDNKAMTAAMSPFDFFAKMWLGADKMIIMQKKELGATTDFTGQELADIIGFLHDPALVKTFSDKDIPENIKAKMDRDEGDEDSGGGKEMKMDNGMMMNKQDN